MNLSLLSAPRVYYAMAADGLFFRRLARLSPRFRAPTAAILLQGGLAAAYALANTYDKLLGYAVFADWIFFALAGASLMVFRRTMPEARAGRSRCRATPWCRCFFILAGAGIVLNTFFADTRNALIGTANLHPGSAGLLFLAGDRGGRMGAECRMRKERTDA